jgi:hypothetical protein
MMVLIIVYTSQGICELIGSATDLSCVTTVEQLICCRWVVTLAQVTECLLETEQPVDAHVEAQVNQYLLDNLWEVYEAADVVPKID